MSHPTPATLKRIHREIVDVRKEDLGNITLVPTDDLFVWSGTLPGPEDSVYEGGVFSIAVNLPSDYPFSAPKVTFNTRIYHMNISDQGNICIDILKHNWSPALSLFKVILSLSSLLTDPNPKDPLVPSIATQYTRNRKLHDSTARQWTALYARPKPPSPSPPPPPPPAKAKTGPKRTAASGSASRPIHDSRPIVIDDSDDELPRRGAGQKRKRDAIPAEIDLAAEEDDIVIVASGSKKQKRVVSDRRSARPTAGSSSRRPAPRIDSGEVIDIDDD
ncbi:ubiquitin-conjugating enzyme/RWD-like protein [Mycena belliarum]|uniref:E2 ubiquitin-conjugating enzyme n=1 Tax=Mycena belliarum TaxID=1033014 RepID=A0AAD6TYH8_9AGAR|nr:ubiquitin-conjugating enzyme/RWD-like protein [Mycena belliae]